MFLRKNQWLSMSLVLCFIIQCMHTSNVVPFEGIGGVDRLTKIFHTTSFLGIPKTEYVAINDLSFQMSPNTVHTVIGPSGSGKSTLMKIMCGIERPTSGTILLEHPYNLESNSIYVDHRFRMTYNSALCINDMEGSFSPRNWKVLMDQTKAPVHERADSLLESDRRVLEVILALTRIDKSCDSVLICFDEYFDKDCKSSHIKLHAFLEGVCRYLDINLQVVIATHSRHVLKIFSRNILVLNRGKLYFQGSGCIKTELLPLQLQQGMIE